MVNLVFTKLTSNLHGTCMGPKAANLHYTSINNYTFNGEHGLLCMVYIAT